MTAPKILPPVYLVLALILMLGLHLAIPITSFITPLTEIIGVAIILGSIAIILHSVFLFRRAKTALRPFEESTRLVTWGLYRFCRNPIYLGMVLVLIGVALVLGTLSPFLVIPVFALQIQKEFVLAEEKFLERIFGEEYLNYKHKIPRWI